MLAGIRSAAASVLGRGGRKRKADEAGAPEEDDRRASRRRIVPSEAGVRARKTKREGKASGAGGGDVADERRGSPYLTRLRRLWHRDSSGDDGSLACASPALRAKAAARPRLSRWELRDVGVDVLDLLVDAMLSACSPADIANAAATCTTWRAMLGPRASVRCALSVKHRDVATTSPPFVKPRLKNGRWEHDGDYRSLVTKEHALKMKHAERAMRSIIPSKENASNSASAKRALAPFASDICELILCGDRVVAACARSCLIALKADVAPHARSILTKMLKRVNDEECDKTIDHMTERESGRLLDFLQAVEDIAKYAAPHADVLFDAFPKAEYVHLHPEYDGLARFETKRVVRTFAICAIQRLVAAHPRLMRAHVGRVRELLAVRAPEDLDSFLQRPTVPASLSAGLALADVYGRYAPGDATASLLENIVDLFTLVDPLVDREEYYRCPHPVKMDGAYNPFHRSSQIQPIVMNSGNVEDERHMVWRDEIDETERKHRMLIYFHHVDMRLMGLRATDLFDVPFFSNRAKGGGSKAEKAENRIFELVDHDDPAVVYNALVAIENMGPRQCSADKVDIIVTAVDDEDEDIRVQALRTVRVLDQSCLDEDQVFTIGERLKDDSESVVRAAIATLEWMPDRVLPYHVDEIVNLLEDEEEDVVMCVPVALSALSKRLLPHHVEQLITYVLDDDDEMLVDSAMETMRVVGAEVLVSLGAFKFIFEAKKAAETIVFDYENQGNPWRNPQDTDDEIVQAAQNAVLRADVIIENIVTAATKENVDELVLGPIKAAAADLDAFMWDRPNAPSPQLLTANFIAFMCAMDTMKSMEMDQRRNAMTSMRIDDSADDARNEDYVRALQNLQEQFLRFDAHGRRAVELRMERVEPLRLVPGLRDCAIPAALELVAHLLTGTRARVRSHTRSISKTDDDRLTLRFVGTGKGAAKALARKNNDRVTLRGCLKAAMLLALRWREGVQSRFGDAAGEARDPSRTRTSKGQQFRTGARMKAALKSVERALLDTMMDTRMEKTYREQAALALVRGFREFSLFDIDVLETLLAYGITVDALEPLEEFFLRKLGPGPRPSSGPPLNRPSPYFVSRAAAALLDSVKHLRGGEVGWKDDQRKIYALVLALKVMRDDARELQKTSPAGEKVSDKAWILSRVAEWLDVAVSDREPHEPLRRNPLSKKSAPALPVAGALPSTVPASSVAWALRVLGESGAMAAPHIEKMCERVVKETALLAAQGDFDQMNYFHSAIVEAFKYAVVRLREFSSVVVPCVLEYWLCIDKPTLPRHRLAAFAILYVIAPGELEKYRRSRGDQTCSTEVFVKQRFRNRKYRVPDASKPGRFVPETIEQALAHFNPHLVATLDNWTSGGWLEMPGPLERLWQRNGPKQKLEEWLKAGDQTFDLIDTRSDRGALGSTMLSWDDDDEEARRNGVCDCPRCRLESAQNPNVSSSDSSLETVPSNESDSPNESDWGTDSDEADSDEAESSPSRTTSSAPSPWSLAVREYDMTVTTSEDASDSTEGEWDSDA